MQDPEKTPPTADAMSAAREARDTTRRWRFAGDVVYVATQSLPDDQRSVIRRLNEFGHQHNLTLDELAEKSGYSASTLSRVLRNDYAGDLGEVCRVLGEFLDLAERRATSRAVEFIETSLYKKIEAVCDQTREFQKISLIIGDTQIGKTASLDHYTRTHNHGTTRKVEMPVGGSLGNFINALRDALNIGDSKSSSIRDRIIRAFDDRMLLIVDEVDRCLPIKGGSAVSIRTLEFIRELYDARKCGVILSATRLLNRALDDDRSEFSKLMEQTRRRRLYNLVLPPTPPRKDLNQFAAHYGLDPAEGEALALQTKVLSEEALGMWLTVMRMASALAGKRKQRLDWKHVLLADTGRRALEKIGGDL